MVRTRSTILAFFLFCFFNTAYGLNVKSQTLSCLSFYQPSVTVFFKNIQSLDDSKKKDTRWLAFPKEDPQTQALLDQLISLTSAQRDALLPQVLKHKHKHREFRKVVLLALYDKTTWFDFIDRATKGPLLDDSMVNSLIPLIRAMPASLQADVLAKVTPDYSKLSKVNFTKFPVRTNLRLAPKRSIDALILHIIKPDEWFKHDIEITNNALETYGRYLQFLKTDIFKNSDRGNYSTAEIITVAEAIQKVLQENIAQFKGTPSITITGSFPNGRAKISDTDLDSRISHQEMHALLDSMSAAVNQAMKAYPYPSKFTVEAMWATTTAHFAAQINPLFLRITPTQIQVEVYSAVRPMHRDSVLMEYNYEAPAQYTLKTNSFEMPNQGIVRLKPKHDGRWVAEQLFSGLEDFSFTTRPSKKPKTAASAQELVDAIQNADHIQKSDLLFTLKNTSVKTISASADAQKLLKLALYDQKTWELLVQDAIKDPQQNDALFNALVPVFEQMPENLKFRIRDLITANYSGISDRAWIRKGLFLKKNYGLISPRDALDIIANQVLPPKAFIETALKSGATFEAAYDQYLTQQHGAFYSKTKTIKLHSAAQIKLIAEKVQTVIKKNPELFGNDGVHIVGRLPNGRADFTDLSVEFIVADPLNKKLLSELSYALNGKTKPRAKEFIEVEVRGLETTTIKEAIVNPVQIHITKNVIGVHVHAPVQNIDRDRFQLPKNYPAPATYSFPTESKVAETKEAS